MRARRRAPLRALLTAVIVLGLAGPAWANEAASVGTSLDTAWVLVAAFLVFFM